MHWRVILFDNVFSLVQVNTGCAFVLVHSSVCVCLCVIIAISRMDVPKKPSTFYDQAILNHQEGAMHCRQAKWNEVGASTYALKLNELIRLRNEAEAYEQTHGLVSKPHPTLKTTKAVSGLTVPPKIGKMDSWADE